MCLFIDGKNQESSKTQPFAAKETTFAALNSAMVDNIRERVELMRRTINDPTYASLALRSEQANGMSPEQTTSRSGEAPLHHHQVEETVMTTKPDSEMSSSDEEGIKSHLDESKNIEVEEEVGWKPKVMNLYSIGQADEDGQLTFTTALPASVKIRRQENKGTMDIDRLRSFAIIHRHEVQGRWTRAHSIEIQNQYLKDRLSVIFEGYSNIDPMAPKLEFYAKFEPFVHRWDRLLAAERNEPEEQGKELLKVLIRTLSEDLEGTFRVYYEFQTTGYIDFANILLAYKPGDIIVRSKDDILSAGILRKASKQKSMFGPEILKLDVEIVDWDGEKRGYRKKRWTMSAFEGVQRISDAMFFPVDSHSQSEEIKSCLIERGHVFEGLCGRHMQTFRGRVGVQRRVSGYRGDESTYLSERVIVDAKAYHRFHTSAPSLIPLQGKKGVISSTLYMTEGQVRKETENLAGLPPLSTIELMLAVPKVKGFALENKSWHKFKIRDLTPVSWSSGVLEKLVIDAEEKRLLLALISRDGVSDNDFDDFVQGKGKGMVLLLGGSSGVGKTLTAEAVAEQLQRPLYRVRAGDLGVEADKVESSLKTALGHCSYWNAVLLIDEADIFLEQRTSDNLARNELVSIFLVLLEYYTGVLILTTNRTDSLDRAFESRIDINILYKDLTPSARREIWSNFIKTLPPDEVHISSKDLKMLSQWVLNGRQIKSAIKSARILAVQEKSPLNMQHLDVVLRIRRKGGKLLCSENDKQSNIEGDPRAVNGIGWWCLSWLLPMPILAIISFLFAGLQKIRKG